MDIQTLVLFAIASLSINLIPGPDIIYIVSNTMKGKAKAGLQASLGLGVGYLFHTLAAVLGLSALITSSALLFSIVKYLGAAYLLYLGFTSLRSAVKGQSTFQLPEGSKGKQTKVFQQGVIVSVLNPKVALFFLSFLPQFIDLNAGNSAMQLLTLGLFFSVLATLCNLTYAVLGSVIFGNPKLKKYTRGIEAVSGTLLVGLAARIALTKQ